MCTLNNIYTPTQFTWAYMPTSFALSLFFSLRIYIMPSYTSTGTGTTSVTYISVERLFSFCGPVLLYVYYTTRKLGITAGSNSSRTWAFNSQHIHTLTYDVEATVEKRDLEPKWKWSGTAVTRVYKCHTRCTYIAVRMASHTYIAVKLRFCNLKSRWPLV